MGKPSGAASFAAWRDRTVVAYLDEPPFFSPDPAGDPTGCDIELVKTILGVLGVRQIDFVLVTFAELLPGVSSGRWNLNAPMFVTAERAELVRFSRPVWAALDGFIVRSEDHRDYSSYESIALDTSVRLAAVEGQKQIDLALSVGVPDSRIVRFEDQEAAVAAVLGGDADASVSTAPGNQAYVARASGNALVSVMDQGTRDSETPRGAFTFSRSAMDLSSAFDAALGEYLGTPEHLAMMGRYGFSAESLAPVLGHR